MNLYNVISNEYNEEEELLFNVRKQTPNNDETEDARKCRPSGATGHRGYKEVLNKLEMPNAEQRTGYKETKEQ